MLLLSLFSLYTDIVELSSSETEAKIMEISMVYYYVSLAFDIILIALLSCLLFGINQDKISLMKPFSIIYAIYIVISFAASIYYDIVYCKFVSNISYDKLRRLCDLNFHDSNSVINTWNCVDYENSLRSGKIYYIITTLIGFIIEIIYYITTHNYIKGVEKEVKEVDNLKTIENPN